MWPWKRRSKQEGESEGAREAKAILTHLEAQEAEVDQLAELGRRQQERNHFGEGIKKAMKRRYA